MATLFHYFIYKKHFILNGKSLFSKNMGKNLRPINSAPSKSTTEVNLKLTIDHTISHIFIYLLFGNVALCLDRNA